MIKIVKYFEVLGSPSAIREDVFDILTAEPLVPGGRAVMLASS